MTDKAWTQRIIGPQQKMIDATGGNFDEHGVLHTVHTTSPGLIGFGCQSFWSSKRIFAFLPKQLGRLDYNTMRPVKTGQWAWLRILERFDSDFGNDHYYTKPNAK